jgi:hypothetical protein
MCESKLHKVLLAATEAVSSSNQTDVDAMFDALVKLEWISRSAVEGHLIATSLQPEWKAVAQDDIVYH